MSRAFIDTNILVYTWDKSCAEKQQRARSLLKELDTATAKLVISTQVLQEFYVTVTQKLGIDCLTAKDALRALSRFQIVQVSPEIIEKAIDLSILNRISFWDALVVSSASKANCSFIYSQDLNSGQIIGGIKVINPFQKVLVD